jgi:hypothetical protein
MSEHHPDRTVDCREYRRRLLIDPRDPDPALARHRAGCADCARATREALAFEATLEQTLKITPPERLETRTHARTEQRVPRRLTLAAAWLLSLGIAGWLGFGAREHWSPEPDLAQVVIEHIRHEPAHLHAVDHVRVDRVVGLFEDLGGELMTDLGPVRFAGLCVIRHGEGAHLVVKGHRGPVTLLFMPGERLETAQKIHAEGLEGWVVPTEYGSLAVVGEPGELLDNLLEKARRGLHWRT